MIRVVSRRSNRAAALALTLLATSMAPLAGARDASALGLPLPLPLPIPPLNLPLGPPALPTIPSVAQVIPSNAPGPSGSTQLPATSATLDAKLLIISADGTEPVLGAIRQAADYEGIPYTLYIASQTPGGFTPAMLSDGGSHAFYEGIVMTTGTLAYYNGTAWTSAFNTAEWQTLWDYQAKYRVRTVISYAYPTTDLGYGPPTGVDATTTPISARLTQSGQSVFSYVNAANPITITKAWTYLAQPVGSGNNVLLSDAAGNALSLIHTYTDGRQVLSQTFDNNFFLVHSLTLAYGTLNWVTGGLFLGERHAYMAPQVDDIFIDDSLYAGGIYRITATDWAAVTAWQTQKQLQSQTGDVLLHMAFNGAGTTGEYSLDTLTPAAELTQSQFPWINHTYDHENLDNVTYAFAYQEITQNDQIATSMGLQNYDLRALVTPDVSGLANANAMNAAYDAGVRYIVTDTSRPGMDNPTPQAGIYNSLQPGILMIPRRPTNLYYNVGTPTDWTNEYNYLYHSYWGRDLAYSEILDKESDVLLQYLLRGEIDPWMFHQTNLQAYDGTHTLLGDLLDRALQKFSAISVLPIRSLTHAQIGDWTKTRMQCSAAGVHATISPSRGTMTITASQPAVVAVTGLNNGSAEQYGGQYISHVTLGAGQSATFNVSSGVGPSQSPTAGVGGNTAVAGAITAVPNPFHPQTSISFTTSRAGKVSARVYDVTGQLVRTLADGELNGGSHSLVWNGAMENGRQAAAGVYFLKLRSPDGESSKRLVLMK